MIFLPDFFEILPNFNNYLVLWTTKNYINPLKTVSYPELRLNRVCKTKVVSGLNTPEYYKANQPIVLQFLGDFMERFFCNLG